MLLTIHDANLQKVAFIDNNKQATLNYYNDTWTRSLETGSSTFEFTVFKKAIQSDTATQKTYNLLNEKAFVSFKYHGKSYVFSVMTVEEDEYTIKCYCENLNLELINEYANPYKSDKAMSFVEYCNAMDLLNFTHLSVGINEIADQKRTLEWEGQDTKLARLLSLAKKFDAEIDFETQLNADSSIKSFKVNVYHEHDDEHQGVGRVRNDVQLIYRKNLKSITRKIDKTGIYTMVVPTGKRTVKNGKGEEVEQIVTIGDLKPPYTENNKDGVREFYQSGNALYAPIAAQMYPSTFTSGTQRDQWIRKDLEVDSDNPTVIRAAGIRNLKKNAYPALSYEVDGFLDVEIGDTCKVYDDGFAPELLVQARVSIQKISFTKPETNKTTFANFKELERNLSAGIQAAFERLFEASKPYTIKLSTDNGVMFKNNAGQTIITPALYKGGKVVSNDVTWRWSLDGNVTTGMTYLVKGSSVKDTVTLIVAAYIGNDEVAVDEISLVNVGDGAKGRDGEDGKSTRLFTTNYRYNQSLINQYSSDGYSGDWVVIENTADTKIGDSVQMRVFNTDKNSDSWIIASIINVNNDHSIKALSKGVIEKGDKGLQGPKGDRGNDGLPGKDGVGLKSTTITYGMSDNETIMPTSWTSNPPTLVKGKCLWTKTQWMYTDLSSETGYQKTYIPQDGSKGDDGLPGKDGVGIRSTAITYAQGASGTVAPTSGWSSQVPNVPVGQFLWTKTVWTYTDNTNETGYSVSKIGEQGPKGDPGSDGKDGNSIRLFTTNYRYNQAFINQYSADGYTGDWSVVENTAGLKVGDSVQIRVFNKDKESDSWIIASIINVNNDHSIKALSKGVIEKGDKGERGAQGERGFQGIQGLQGPKGDQGIPGIKGADGRTQYTHIAYADNATGGGFSQTDQSKAYIGMYQDFVATDSNNPTAYKWSKWRGSDGAQGIPGKPGADGKTPYIHFAYADDANGTGFSRTDKNQQYYGYYSDYTEDDSTDYKKYKWVDRLANVQVGGRNLLKNSAGPFKPDRKPTANYDNLEYYTKSIIDMVNGKQYILTAETDGVITNSHDGSINNDNVVIWLASLDYKIHSIISDGNTDKKGTVFTWAYPTGKYMLRVNTYKKVSDKSVWKVKIAEGNTKTGWSPAPEDVQADIDSKADNALTQEQLNALNEKAQIQDAELKAKASMEAFSELEKAYNAFVKSNADARKKSEADLAEAGRRIALLTTQFGGLKELKTFIDTYMSSSNEGLIIGKNDASSTIKVSSDRISMFSAGKEVMYISQGVIHIDNGIFTASVQIGRFRTEQYNLNSDINVIRYVGGV